jgi:hypothetical protein
MLVARKRVSIQGHRASVRRIESWLHDCILPQLGIHLGDSDNKDLPIKAGYLDRWFCKLSATHSVVECR